MNKFCVIILAILFSTFIHSQEDPTLTIVDNGVITEGIDPWNGEVCLFLGYPSQPANTLGIRFFASDLQSSPSALTVTATSSNPFVIPLNSNNINLNYDPSNGDTRLFLNPLRDGVTDIIIRVMDEDWNSSSYYLKVIVKSCKDILCVSMNNIDVLPHGLTQVYSASNHIKTLFATNAPMIRANDDIEFYGGNFVQLNPGFEVKPGGEFLADIDNCN